MNSLVFLASTCSFCFTCLSLNPCILYTFDFFPSLCGGSVGLSCLPQLTHDSGFLHDLCVSNQCLSFLQTLLEYTQKNSSVLNKQLLDYLKFTFSTSLKCFYCSESHSSLGFSNLNASFTVLIYLLCLTRMSVDSFFNGFLILGFQCILSSFFDFLSVLNSVLSCIPMMRC